MSRSYPPNEDRPRYLRPVEPSAILPAVDNSTDDLLAIAARLNAGRHARDAAAVHERAVYVVRLQQAILTMSRRYAAAMAAYIRTGLRSEESAQALRDMERRALALGRLVDALGRLALFPNVETPR